MGEKNNKIVSLIERIHNGDKNAYNQLCKKYEKSIKRFISFNVLIAEDVDDIFQSGWKYFLEKDYISKYDSSKGSFYNYLAKNFRWHIRNYYKVPEYKKKFEQMLSDINGNNSKVCNPEKEMMLIKNYFYGNQGVKFEPEKHLFQVELFDMLLKAILLDGGQPHQCIVTCFSKYLMWAPIDIEKELSRLSLYDLSERLRNDTKKVSEKNNLVFRKETERTFNKFIKKLNKKVGYFVKKNNRKDIDESLLKKVVGCTSLCDYFKRNPSHNLSVWSNRVLKRVKEIFLEKFPEFLLELGKKGEKK